MGEGVIVRVKKKFLPNVSKNRLRKMEKNKKEPKAKMILLACIVKKRKKESSGDCPNVKQAIQYGQRLD